MAPLALLACCVCLVLGVQGNADMEAKKLFQDFVEWRFKEAPEYATTAGFHRHNDRLKTYTMDAMSSRKNMAEEFLRRVQDIDPGELSKASDRISLAVLEDMLERYTEGYEWRFYTGLNPVHFMSKTMRQLSKIATIAPLYTVGDFENYISRLNAFDTSVNEYITIMREAERTGYTLHNVSISRVFDLINAFLKPATESALYDPFIRPLNDHTTLTNQEKENYRHRGASAINSYNMALRRLNEFLRREYAPRTRSFYGVHGFSQGKEFYAACLRWYLSYNATPEAVHQLGLQEVDRIQDNMRQVMAKQGHNGTVKEYFDRLKEDSRFFKQSGEEILEEYRSMIRDRIQPKILDYFESVPPVPVRVRPTATDGVMGSYSQGSPDGSRPGYFNANTFRPRERPIFSMMALTLHETIPGHHMQIMQAMFSDMPTFRKFYEASSGTEVPFLFPAYTAFIEGWGLYGEYLGEEMGMYQDDYELMGRYSSEMFRACRLVVDTGLHFYGWDRERAIQYMLNYTSMSRASVEIEVDRYLTNPGQACSYKVGEIKIREARQSAEEKLGDKFDLKKFHALVLNNGAVPLGLLEELVDDWVQSQEPQQQYQQPSTPSVALAHNTGASAFPSRVSVLLLVTAVLAPLCAL